MINVEMVLPDFARMVNFCINQNRTKPKVLFSAEMAFSESENKLLGSAIKFCSLNNVTVHCIGNGAKKTTYLDGTDYSVYDVEELGKKVRSLCSKHESVILKAKYWRICETCGEFLDDLDEEGNEVVTFVRDPMNQRNQQYYLRKDGKEKIVSYTLNEVKAMQNKRNGK